MKSGFTFFVNLIYELDLSFSDSSSSQSEVGFSTLGIMGNNNLISSELSLNYPPPGTPRLGSLLNNYKTPSIVFNWRFNGHLTCVVLNNE